MKNLLSAGLTAIALLFAGLAYAQPVTFRSADGLNNTPVSAANPLPVEATLDIGEITSSTAAAATASAPTYDEGEDEKLSQTLTGDLRTTAKQNGTWNITNVSGTVSLPTGAATAAKQPALGTAGSPSSDVITVQGSGSGTALPVSITTVPSHAVTNAGTFAVQNNAATPAGTNVIGKVSLVDSAGDNATDAANDSIKVSIVSGGGSGGTASDFGDPVPAAGTAAGFEDPDGDLAPGKVDANGNLLVAGVGSAQGAAIAGQTLSPTACQTLSATPTAYTTAQTNIPTCTVYGAQLTQPYSLNDNLVSGTITSAMTGTTSTSLIAAAGSGLKNYITQITCWNSHATVGTAISLQDGSGGTVFYSLPAAAVYGGAVISFPAPLKQPTANTALYVVNETTGASTKCSASGFKAP